MPFCANFRLTLESRLQVGCVAISPHPTILLGALLEAER